MDGPVANVSGAFLSWLEAGSGFAGITAVGAASGARNTRALDGSMTLFTPQSSCLVPRNLCG